MAKNKKLVKEQKWYQHLLERYEEMNDYLLDLMGNPERTMEDMWYMNDFIHYKNLDEVFNIFRKHAHEDQDTDLPFPYLVL